MKITDHKDNGIVQKSGKSNRPTGKMHNLQRIAYLNTGSLEDAVNFHLVGNDAVNVSPKEKSAVKKFFRFLFELILLVAVFIYYTACLPLWLFRKMTASLKVSPGIIDKDKIRNRLSYYQN